MTLTRTVEVAGVLVVFQLRHELRLLSEQTLPVDPVEEQVFLDLVGAAAAQPLHRVVLQQQTDEILSIFRRCKLVFRPVHALR